MSGFCFLNSFNGVGGNLEPFGMHAVFFDIVATNRKESAETDVEGKVFDLDAFGLKFFDKFFGHIKTSGRGGGGAEFFSPDSLIAFDIILVGVAMEIGWKWNVTVIVNNVG